MSETRCTCTDANDANCPLHGYGEDDPMTTEPEREAAAVGERVWREKEFKPADKQWWGVDPLYVIDTGYGYIGRVYCNDEQIRDRLIADHNASLQPAAPARDDEKCTATKLWPNGESTRCIQRGVHTTHDDGCETWPARDQDALLVEVARAVERLEWRMLRTSLFLTEAATQAFKEQVAVVKDALDAARGGQVG